MEDLPGLFSSVLGLESVSSVLLPSPDLSSSEFGSPVSWVSELTSFELGSPVSSVGVSRVFSSSVLSSLVPSLSELLSSVPSVSSSGSSVFSFSALGSLSAPSPSESLGSACVSSDGCSVDSPPSELGSSSSVLLAS